MTAPHMLLSRHALVSCASVRFVSFLLFLFDPSSPQELADIFDAVSSLQRRIATVRTIEFTILANYISVFASFATATLQSSYQLLPRLPPGGAASTPDLFTPPACAAAMTALHDTLGSLLGVLRTAARRPPDEVVPLVVAALPGLTSYHAHLVAMATTAGAAAATVGAGAEAVAADRRRVGSTLVGAGKFRRWHLLMVERAARQLANGAKAAAAAAAGAGKPPKDGRGRREGGGRVSAGVWQKVVGGSYRRQYEVGHVNEIKMVIELE